MLFSSMTISNDCKLCQFSFPIAYTWSNWKSLAYFVLQMLHGHALKLLLGDPHVDRLHSTHYSKNVDTVERLHFILLFFKLASSAASKSNRWYLNMKKKKMMIPITVTQGHPEFQHP